MQLVPLGDQAVLAYCSDEAGAFALAESARQQHYSWLVDVVQAYTTVAVFYDLAQVNFAKVADLLAQCAKEKHRNTPTSAQAPLQRIPCCYEFELDLARVAGSTGLTSEQVIRLHLDTTYTVYAIGFCPGFPYLGYLPPALCNVPRLAQPRLRVEAGSVGLTGRQTGIYTEARPGGWNLIGRTPLELVYVADGYFPLRTGDKVMFERIGKREFRKLLGRRLQSPHFPVESRHVTLRRVSGQQNR
jgi:inhibitor of KinA